MSLSMYRSSVPIFVRLLTALSANLDKAAAHAEEKNIDPAAYLQARLYPDMYPLTRQVRAATDFARNCAARLAGLEPPQMEDTETTFPELKTRIERTIGFLNNVKPAQIDGSEEKTIAFKMGPRDVSFSGTDYLLVLSMPNFFFHVTTAYAILRHNGIVIGKRDFMGTA